jgi:hypothetical protein
VKLGFSYQLYPAPEAMMKQVHRQNPGLTLYIHGARRGLY